MDARISIRLVAACLLVVSLAAAQSSRRRSEAHVETERLTLSYSPSDLEPNAAAAFLTLADEGLTHIESALKLKYTGEKIQFRVSRRVRISNAYGSRINLPLTRVQQRSAPYLHETTHVLMQQYSRGYQPPTWLNEGFASYIESYIADEFGGYDAHVFTRDGNRSVHAEAREHLETSYGRQAEPYIIRSGAPPGLARDRERVAPPFYVLSQSFVKFLVAAIGLESVKNMHRGGDHLEKPQRRLIDEWKVEWLRSLRQ
jgi:hypothetical protein